MASGMIEQLEFISERHPSVSKETQQIQYSAGVMAYNEEANIKRTLHAILEQNSDAHHISWELQRKCSGQSGQ